MSLKAKIEAVIYASEEPVTLAQLVGLLGHEAQAELDHLEAAQQSLGLEEADGDSEALNSEVLSDADETEANVLSLSIRRCMRLPRKKPQPPGSPGTMPRPTRPP